MCRGGLPALRRGRGPFQLPAARGGGQGVSQTLCFAGRRRRRRCWTAPERDAAPMFRRRRRCEWGAGESRRGKPRRSPFADRRGRSRERPRSPPPGSPGFPRRGRGGRGATAALTCGGGGRDPRGRGPRAPG